MIITRTPIRITFFGGGTDYPDYFNRKKGITLNLAINKYSYIVLNENKNNFNSNYILSYKKLEKTNNIKKIKHFCIKSCLKYFNIKKFIEIHYISDIPAKTGLGSSSSFTVGLIRALSSLKKLKLNNFQIAKKAIFIEQVLNGERVGCQDQISCAMGGLGLTKYSKKKIIHKKIKINSKRLDKLISNLLIFYTGKTRFAEKILKEQTYRNKLGKNDNFLDEIKKITNKALNVLQDERSDLKKFGQLLHQTWLLKKKLSSKVSNKFIDKYYRIAIDSGAIGGKVLGAGSGGFLMFYVPKNKQTNVIKNLSSLKLIQYGKDDLGTQVIFK